MVFLSDLSNSVATFGRRRGSKDRKPRKRLLAAADRVASAGTSAPVGLISTGLGFGAGAGLLLKPENGKYQRKAMLIGTGVGAGLAGYQALRNRFKNKQQ